MNFSESVSTCMGKYGTFSGRASRSEFWWFQLFYTLMYYGSFVVEQAIPVEEPLTFSILPVMLVIIFIVPSMAAGSRRLHDIGKSGWWQLLHLIPIIGTIFVVFWQATDTKSEGDKYNQIEAS